jgi:hypothetical protein
MTIRDCIARYLGEQYGLSPLEAYQCLEMVDWCTLSFRVIADDCMWGINPRIFRERLRDSVVLLRYLVEERQDRSRNLHYGS